MSNQAATGGKKSGMKLSGKQIGAIILGVLALLFVFSNTETATLKFLWMEFTAPGWMMLLIVLLSGVAVGFMFGRKRYKP